MAMTEPQSAHFRSDGFLAHAVWLYDRFQLYFRYIGYQLAERGIEVSFQPASEWVAKFGLKFARQPRRRSRGHFAGNGSLMKWW